MLKWLALAAALTPLVLHSALAHAQGEDSDDGLRRPEQVTVGTGDQFLGQLSPDEKTLYFVSNREARKQIYAQDLEQGRVQLAFDEGSDVTWPRVSPDGKALLYISFREQATGQLCVRSLPDGDDRRCLEDRAAALQGEWLDARHIALVERASIGGNLRVSEVSVAAQLSQRSRFEQNWTSPAVSPDGRWLVFVPLDRVTEHVGPGFAARAASQLAVVRLDGTAPPVPLRLDLPGSSGQPAFSRDGRFLYFVQFFSDSNHDGVIDASDHGVLFRVPFASDSNDAPSSSAALAPLQLTDTSANCQYPSPAVSTLVATCARGTNLAVYTLPLDGEIPSAWGAERLRQEIELSARRSEQLLLYRHALSRRTDPKRERLIMMRLVLIHLELEQFAAAQFYAQKIAALRDPSTRGIGRPLLALVEHRQARAALERGRTTDTFEDEAKAELAKLSDKEQDSPTARLLSHVVRSEINDALGDKSAARRELEAGVITDETPRGAIEAYYARADALYRELDDRDALFALCGGLAARPALDPEVRLEYARAAVRALLRGRPLGEATAQLARARDAEAPDSELGFALELGRLTLAIQSDHPGPAVKASLIALYEAQPRLDRKRAIVLDALERAAELGADSIVEAVSERYVDDVQKGTGERRRAEQLYRRAIVGRAFRRLAKGRRAEARADFDAVFRRTGSLQAASESIEIRLQEGQSAGTIAAELARGASDPTVIANFVQASVIARQLPNSNAEAHERAVGRAQNLLRASWATLKNKGPVRALFGALMHQRYLVTGSLAAAEAANTHYLVALERVPDDPRFRASLLDALGLLQTEVGNYRIALGYFEHREKLPYATNASALSSYLAEQEAWLHVGKETESAAAAERALSVLQQSPALARYGTLVFDRAALAHLAAGNPSRALALYDAELPALSKADNPAAQRNRYVVRLGRAAAAVGAGKPQVTLDEVSDLEKRLDDPRVAAELASPHVTPEQAAAAYRTLTEGLRANASAALGQLDVNAAALLAQHTLIEARFTSSNRDEDLRALTLLETRLSENARLRHDWRLVAHWIALALQHADSRAARIRAEIDVDQLRVLWFAASFATLDHGTLPFDWRQRVSDAQRAIVKQRGHALRSYERWFEIFLAM